MAVNEGESIGSGAVSGAASGALAGSAGGVVGTVVGGIIGLVGGAVSGWAKYNSEKSTQDQADAANSANQRSADAQNYQNVMANQKAWKWNEDDRTYQQQTAQANRMLDLLTRTPTLLTSLGKGWGK